MIEKKFLTIDKKRIAYLDKGEGVNLLFIHGNPTSSFLWRNIIKGLDFKYRCIAPDLIGMGDSDKLENVSLKSYSFFEHKEWLKKFIKNLNLENKLYLILHDWGSALGFDFAKENPDLVAGIVYMEAIVCPLKWSDWPHNAKKIFQLLRSNPGIELIHKKNIFVERILPSSVIRTLSDTEMNAYRKPFLKEGFARQPTLSWPRQIPIDGSPIAVSELVDSYASFMKNSSLRKLFINAEPGSILIGRQREFCRTWKNQKEVTVKGIHFIQEDSPDEIAYEIDKWIQQDY